MSSQAQELCKIATNQSIMSTYHHGNLKAALLERAAEVIDEGGVEALSMRGLARDLKVSSAASARHFNGRSDLLSTLATEGYRQATEATLAAAEKAGQNPITRLNAMGKAFVHWSVKNKALFHTISHPDVSRHADDKLREALGVFALTIGESVRQAQGAGWRENEDTNILFRYAIATVRGIAFNASDDLYTSVFGRVTKPTIDKLIDAIVPIEEA
jgi:AcrR family transcriptional regulator